MKKIILLISSLLLVQFATAQVNIGARMGLNLGMFDMENKNIEEDYKMEPNSSILIKMDVDMPFSTVFSFRTGLGLVIKGAEIDGLPESKIHPDTNWSLLYRMNYLEVPLLLVARAETDFYGTFYFGAGPTLSLGVGGKMDLFAKHKDDGGQRQITEPIVWGNKPAPSDKLHNYNYFRRFDLGLGAMFSYQLPRSGLAFTLSYNKALRNISPNEGVDLKTSYVGLSIGFIMKN
ncbi:MAG: PorT family protein [Bacteroidales bacterium]|nr:PorT family protein [Bacteroidales bacterium]